MPDTQVTGQVAALVTARTSGIAKAMSFNRRYFLGALAAGSVSMVAPRAQTMPRGPFLPATPPPTDLLPARPLPAVGLRPALLARAMAAFDSHAPRLANRSVIGVVDFSAPSHATRLHLVNVASGKVMAEHLVAHGHGSDPDNSGWVERFSNQPGSNASSSGSFLASDIYTGKHGRSRRLVGLDPQNSLALDRGIVIHAASYVDATMARTQGRVGRSQGCFAVSTAAIEEVLARLGPGCLIYAGKHT